MRPPIFIRSDLAEALTGWPPPVLDPAGPHAASVTLLAWVLFAMGVIVLLIVIAALGVALFGNETLRQRIGKSRTIWIGGIAFPVVVLTLLLVWGLGLTGKLTAADAEGDAMRIRVTGEMWWWRVAYLDEDGKPAMHDANEIHIPVGQPVVLELESADVIHSFWIPRLAGKLDMIPGRRNLLRIQADKPGVYGGQCAEYCGGAHALMGFLVIAHEPASFARWTDARAAAAAPPETQLAANGADLFLSSGCGACHAVRGTEANGLAGPDLTHIGSRRSLGAGILPNNRGTLAGWVADSQTVKPGNRMPTYRTFTGQELQAMAAYLEQLR